MTTFLGNPVTFTGHQVRDTAYDSSLTTLNFEKKSLADFAGKKKYLS
ncbi:thiol peroxidase [Streptococcus vestibularis F0396]|uniref:Thiol peroxidase n=1 Tax=Streptococcus vestibularis F0396 TaxID=904306 RepID=E3CQY9_STRVE|nr:thiol peroxidase [Streptococcus vestibularis F0396]